MKAPKRYIWLCGPSACGKVTLLNDAARLGKLFAVEQPYTVRTSGQCAEPRYLLSAAALPGITAVVQVWQWRTHQLLMQLHQVVRPPDSIEVVLLKPDLRDWVCWYESKYSPIEPRELMDMWTRTDKLLTDTVPWHVVLPIPYSGEHTATLSEALMTYNEED